MKKFFAIVLLVTSFSAFSVSATREELPVAQGSHPKEVILSTMDIPARASVLVYCKVKLPHYYKSKFSFYVMPQVGEFGGVERYEGYHEKSKFRSIGSKIYMYDDSDVFHIKQVKQSNEAIVFDLSKMPDGTTVSCSF